MRSNDEQQINDLLGGVYKKLRITDKVVQHRVKETWDILFGATFAKYLRKLEFKENTLYIYISSDSLRHELFLNRSKIRERMNEELKEQLIKEVILR